MRYNECVGGVLLAVSDLSFSDGASEGRIKDEMPHIHFDVKAKAQVFRPRPGHVLEGRVNKVLSCWCFFFLLLSRSPYRRALHSGHECPVMRCH